MKSASQNDTTQDVTLFREILFLPLRLSSPDDRNELAALFAALPPRWAVPSDNLAFQNASAVWPIWPEPAGNAPGESSGQARDKSNGEYRLVQAYNEAAYFHPYVQRFLYGFGEANAALRPVETRMHNGIDRIKIRMDYNDGKGAVKSCPSATHFEIEMAVDRIELNHVREPGLIILIVELACRADAPLRRFDGEGGEIPGLHLVSMAEVLALKDGVRRLYPPYFTGLSRNQVDMDGVKSVTAEAHWARHFFPASVQFLGSDPAGADAAVFDGAEAFAMAEGLALKGNLPAAPWWRALLAPLLDAKGKSGKPLVQQVVDERMPSLSFVAVPDIAKVDRATQTRLCFADGPGSGYVYTESFLADFEKMHCYDRFLSSGTRYMFSSYSLTMLCQTNVLPGARPPKNGDFALDVLQQHARRHYLRMMMLAHVQRASLLAFSNWISIAMHDSATLRDPDYRSRIDNLRHDFAKFTQISWFSNVSNQEQARDMFALLQHHLGNAPLQGEVLSELDGARAVLTEIDAERQAESAMVFNIIAAVATFIGLPLAAISTLTDLNARLPQLPALSRSFAVLFIALAVIITAAARRQALGSVFARQFGRSFGLFAAYTVTGLLAAAGLWMLFCGSILAIPS